MRVARRPSDIAKPPVPDGSRQHQRRVASCSILRVRATKGSKATGQEDREDMKKHSTRHRRSGRKHPVRRPIRGKHESRLTYPGIALRKHPHTPPPRRELCMSPSTPWCECIIILFSSRTALPQRRLIHTPLTPRQEFKRGHSATTPPHFGGATRIPMPQRHRGHHPRRQRRVCAVTSS